jgi:hypothetical protein
VAQPPRICVLSVGDPRGDPLLNKQLILRAVGLDETASKRGHNYVTVFIDMDRRDKPVIFVVPGKGLRGRVS